MLNFHTGAAPARVIPLLPTDRATVSAANMPLTQDAPVVSAHSGFKALEHPLGNFGGALSWPVPMHADDQRKALAAALRHGSQNPNPPQIGASLGVLEYLHRNQPPLDDPASTLEALVNSARGRALGQVIQTELNGLATDTSVNEYTLAAINLTLDPESIAQPLRNRVAGFNLAHPDHWGKPASAVLAALSEHLSSNGKTSPAMAATGAYLLLARKAPVFLIKDIPDSVTYGSPAWVSLAIAAATIEAKAPGKVPNMTFAQVMSAAESAGLDDRAVTEQAQVAALIDWGVVNGIVPGKADDHYSLDEVERARTAFNQQQKERIVASRLLEVEIPSRQDIALAKLKEQFGNDLPFEEKLLKVDDPRQPGIEPLYNPNRAPAGLYSILDIAMMELNGYRWKTSDRRIPVAAINAPLKPEVNKTFDAQFSEAIDSRKQGIATTIKHMVAKLPLADRRKLEQGQLEFFQKKTYALGTDFTSKTLHHTDESLLLKASGANGVVVYKIDLKNAEITTVPTSVLTEQIPRNANKTYKTETFTPTKAGTSDLGRGQPQGSLPPSSFTTARTKAIADVFVEHLNIDNQDVVKQAKGITPLDRQREQEWKVTNFFLDLVPLRSAIVNFQNGNYVDGAMDLAMDAFGFLTAGAGVAGKVAKAGTRLAGTAAKAAKVSRIIGTTLVREFNPLNGLDDLVLGGARLIRRGGAATMEGTELGNRLLTEFKVPESKIAGLSRNSQGLYVAADGHVSHIRHTDSTGQSAVYEVREATRTADGVVQARIYHNNRQTPVLVQHVQGDQWQRFGARGGSPQSVASDLGPEIGRGGEGVVYESLDGKSVYKDFNTTNATRIPDYVTQERDCLNKYYGEGFATAVVENGRAYIKMGKLDGVNLATVERRSLTPEARTWLDDALKGMEEKGIRHQDLQLKNFLYSAADKRVYPVDIQSLSLEDMVPGDGLYEWEMKTYNSRKKELLRDFGLLVR
ncbi:hypothetical protein HX875_20055 [Pseudomonas yamanorum]|uniref:OspG family effector kinase n=1 Tax=Pseudomonas yamanorum TaxID=515393 RepID=UPI0015A2D089|nr:hypothetical protein [Pseudomonas yamanorum]NWE41780.1 hypothetical protein [Pseudomonas yamanorum]